MWIHALVSRAFFFGRRTKTIDMLSTVHDVILTVATGDAKMGINFHLKNTSKSGRIFHKAVHHMTLAQHHVDFHKSETKSCLF